MHPAGLLPGVRITPACAGSTGTAARADGRRSDHPRLRGEHPPPRSTQSLSTGSPPPARGARADVLNGHGGLRITPACAGSTRCPINHTPNATDHPRLRGEHGGFGCQFAAANGSPPPARGARRCGVPDSSGRRITPACAGSTHCGGALSSFRTDHPRLRGEHPAGYLPCGMRDGSPPPARGALPFVFPQLSGPRITPACAGSTDRGGLAGREVTDHPRLRGEHPLPLHVPAPRCTDHRGCERSGHAQMIL